MVTQSTPTVGSRIGLGKSRVCRYFSTNSEREIVTWAILLNGFENNEGVSFVYLTLNMNLFRRRRRYSHTFFYFLSVCLVFGLILTAFNVYELSSINQPGSKARVIKIQDDNKPVVWIDADNIKSGYLNHLIDVLDRVGYTYYTHSDCDWDVLWSHNYPFVTLADKLQKLQPHQKVNHFPGSGFITNKASLVSITLPVIPIAFKIPEHKAAFLEEAKKHPDKLWVVKSNGHRGVSVKNPEEIGFDVSDSSSFIQEFISKPLLISGRMFDIGIYTVLTSVDPLRVYVFERDVLIRFCTKDYYPFDAKDVNKYVVGDDYTPPRDIPALKEIYLKGKFSRLEVLSLYLRQNNKDDRKIWKDIKQSIAEVYKLKERNIIEASGNYDSSRNFFELVRFDFVLDENTNVWLLEVNMSPNLSSAAHSHNKLMYEKVIYNMLTLTGISHFTRRRYKDSFQDERDMRASDEDLQVKEVCATRQCLESCLSQDCELCNSCLDDKTRTFLRMAYMEHVNKGGFRRVYPSTMSQEDAKSLSTNRTSLKFLSRANRLMHDWFIHKCSRDATFCS